MAVTVKDLIEKLQQYPEDEPVFWGIDSLPCWEAKKNKTIYDFPLRQDIAPYPVSDSGFYYLYFGDFDDVDKVREECRTKKRIHRQYYSLWRHIYDILFRAWQ